MAVQRSAAAKPLAQETTTAVVEETKPAAQPPAEPVERDVDVTILVPLAGEQPESDYRARRVDVHLDPNEADTMRRLVVALDRKQACLAGGKRVITPNDAVRWLLDRLGEAG